MSFILDCNHRDVFSNGGMALHYTNVQTLADTCTDKPAHTLACMRAPDTTGIVPNVTPKIVALTNGQRLSSNLEENRV